MSLWVFDTGARQLKPPPTDAPAAGVVGPPGARVSGFYTKGPLNVTGMTGGKGRPVRIYGYVRVSTEEQGRSGLGLDAQRNSISLEAERRGWKGVEWVVDDGYSAKDLHRPGIKAALDGICKDDVLVVAKLDRLSRSILDFAGLAERARQEGWSLVALDLGVDTTTAAGELVANVMAAVAQWERRAIGERTSAAMQSAKARGTHVGRPVEMDADLRSRILRDREGGATLAAIAHRLTGEGVPTVRGGKCWYPSTVGKVLSSVADERRRRDLRAGVAS